MKTNFKLMIAAAAVVFGMAACQQNPEVDNHSNPSTVSLVLTQNGGNVAKAVGDPVTDQVTVTFNSGYVIFTNAVGAINKVTEIVAGTYNAGAVSSDDVAFNAGNKAWLNDLTTANTGAQIKNVPGAANKVYIIGNLPAGFTAPATGQNISSVKASLISITSQGNAAGSVANVTLYGDGVALATPPAGHPANGQANVKYAKVNVNAISSRLELGGITYNGSTGFVTAFRIDGIFVNNYYPTIQLDGEATTALVNTVPGTAAAADVAYAGGSTVYTAADEKITYDYNATSGLGTAATAISYNAGASKVWAYNVLAPTTFSAPVTALVTPHLVIRLSNIVTPSQVGAYPTTQYLTVKQFKAAGTGNVITSFQPGYVYYITNLTFDESNLTDKPEEEAVTVYVEAVLMKWTRQEVTVVL